MNIERLGPDLIGKLARNSHRLPDGEREGTRANHRYNLLGHIDSNASGGVVEPDLITLTDASDVFPTVRHDGIETFYILEGEVDYRHGEDAPSPQGRRYAVL